MAKIMDYILWRGDLSFDLVPINQVDIAVLTQLSLLDFSKVIKPGEKVRMEDAFIRYDESGNDANKRVKMIIFQKIYEVFRLLSKTNRFKDVLISDFKRIYSDEPCQFEAITIHLKDDVLISYGGTDDSIAGWHEDFQLIYLNEIPAHRYGRKYLKSISRKTDKNIILCGHSKGANIAMKTILDAPDDVVDRIKNVYCFDGPGINKEHYDEAVVEHKIDKIISYIPYRSSIGKLFDHYEKVKIVECDANLLFQHDVLTWHVETNDFIYVEEESPESVYLDSHIKKLVLDLDMNSRELFVSALFNILYYSNIYKYEDIAPNRTKILSNVLKLSKEERKVFNTVFLNGVLRDAQIRKMLISILVEKNKIV